MNDIDKMMALFDELGVERCDPEPRDDGSLRAVNGPTIWLSVSQAHFIFDVNGRYLGVLADELGGFDPRNLHKVMPSDRIEQ